MDPSKKNFSNHRSFSLEFLHGLAQKPFSLFAAIAALTLLSLVVFELIKGNLYIARLYFVDATTLVMVALLILRAVTKLQSASDLQTISIALVSSLSFLFGYEAIYKWSFYILPWKIPPAELRELLLQIGVGLVILTGFAFQIFKLRRVSQILLGLFIVTWLFWFAVGFPQLWDGANSYNATLDLPMSWNMIYAVNRVSKFVWFLLYFYLYV